MGLNSLEAVHHLHGSQHAARGLGRELRRLPVLVIGEQSLELFLCHLFTPTETRTAGELQSDFRIVERIRDVIHNRAFVDGYLLQAAAAVEAQDRVPGGILAQEHVLLRESGPRNGRPARQIKHEHQPLTGYHVHKFVRRGDQ